ncbi:AAA family ATPase [Aestuariimicrobium sp. T2.26MG-19.2B]|uniref:AAA family ATPase n=1 Tax=Aestuariimicrobium sp. T2.26MG-19.2B TaxID=3040679 RepID=UPI0024774063|nr:AAA family ATPase [Aestuariimicrobium sp. T2.26MG-19.2B]CAI9409477.1 hypothetical protein AESSP_02242 [Aestuariimicrobium sp. T2.26MG-19.2B]
MPAPEEPRPDAPRVVLINGAPGSGKSTIAALLAAEMPLGLALDIDQLKFSLGGWSDDLNAAGLQARRLALALVRQQLLDGHGVVIGQYLARTPFIEQLEQTTVASGGRFREVVLRVAPATLRQRLTGRAERPHRPEHQHNNTLVGPEQAEELTDSMVELVRLRPHALVVDGDGDIGTTLGRIRERITP